MSTEVKNVILTGAAAQDMAGGVKKEKKSRSKKVQQGGTTIIKDVSTNGQAVQGVSSTQPYVSNAGSPNPNTWLGSTQQTLIPPPIKPLLNPTNSLTTQYNIPSQTGGTIKHIKVELKKKIHTKKVHLQPKKVEAPKSTTHKKSHTKKSRKVTLGIRNLHKRMTRAKKMTRKAKDMPIDKLKEQLIQKKLIKSTSKAPESVLRQIAADAQIVAGKAL
jgi:hypothetical protein